MPHGGRTLAEYFGHDFQELESRRSHLAGVATTCAVDCGGERAIDETESLRRPAYISGLDAAFDFPLAKLAKRPASCGVGNTEL